MPTSSPPLSQLFGFAPDMQRYPRENNSGPLRIWERQRGIEVGGHFSHETYETQVMRQRGIGVGGHFSHEMYETQVMRQPGIGAGGHFFHEMYEAQVMRQPGIGAGAGEDLVHEIYEAQILRQWGPGAGAEGEPVRRRGNGLRMLVRDRSRGRSLSDWPLLVLT